METVHTLMGHCYPLDTPSVPTRLAKAVLPSVLVILTPLPKKEHQAGPMTSSKSRKTKKRSRGYEGGEIFNLSRRVICPGRDDGRVLFAALDGGSSPGLNPVIKHDSNSSDATLVAES